LYPADIYLPTYEISLKEAHIYTYEKVLELNGDDSQNVKVFPDNSEFVIVEY
jgi:hypothetical protein